MSASTEEGPAGEENAGEEGEVPYSTCMVDETTELGLGVVHHRRIIGITIPADPYPVMIACTIRGAVSLLETLADGLEQFKELKLVRSSAERRGEKS